MESLFGWIEAVPISVWTRESTSVWAFPAILSAHGIGMALAVGVNWAIALQLLGVGVRSGTSIGEMRRFVPVLWLGFWLNTASGLLLLLAYPTKALTNPVFYLKMLLIATGMAIFSAISRRLFRDPQTREPWSAGTRRLLAVASLVSWAGAIASGRLLAYTYRHLLAGL